MRTIKFRGQRVDNGEWVYGYLFYTQYASVKSIGLKPCIQIIKDGIYHSLYEVKPETIGQFIGLQDKNGVEIYENDIVKFTRNIGNYQVGKSVPYTTTHEIIWQEDISAFVLKDVGGYIKFRRLDGQYIYEVIGNIHENPELL